MQIPPEGAVEQHVAVGGPVKRRPDDGRSRGKDVQRAIPELGGALRLRERLPLVAEVEVAVEGQRADIREIGCGVGAELDENVGGGAIGEGEQERPGVAAPLSVLGPREGESRENEERAEEAPRQAIGVEDGDRAPEKPRARERRGDDPLDGTASHVAIT